MHANFRTLALAAALTVPNAAARAQMPPPLPMLELQPPTKAGRQAAMQIADGLEWDASVATLCGRRRMEWSAVLMNYVRRISASPRLNLGNGWTAPDQVAARQREFDELQESLVRQHSAAPEAFCAKSLPLIPFARDDAMVQRLHPAPLKPGEGLFDR